MWVLLPVILVGGGLVFLLSRSAAAAPSTAPEHQPPPSRPGEGPVTTDGGTRARYYLGRIEMGRTGLQTALSAARLLGAGAAPAIMMAVNELKAGLDVVNGMAANDYRQGRITKNDLDDIKKGIEASRKDIAAAS